MPSFKRHYNYIVIGAGCGGLTAAVGLKKAGIDVLLVGEDVGGECTHTGCIPSKSFLSLAMHYVWKSQKLCNIELREGIFERIREKVDELEKRDKSLISTNDVPFLHGRARFIDTNTIEAEETRGGKKRTITFNTCVVATGSRPQRITVEGLPEKKILTNTELFNLKELPSRVVVFGGGPIGTEISTAFAKFCTHTTMIVRSDMIPHEPRECVNIVKKSLTEEFNTKIYENVKEMKYEKESGKLFLYDDNNHEIAHVLEADYYMMALGRLPNIESLDLDKAGVKYEKAGILVDKNMKTANKRIFAIGDVTLAPKFAHMAKHHAKYIVDQALVSWKQYEEMPLPACTYSDPPIASVGANREEGNVRKFVVDFGKSSRGRVESAEGLIGVIFVDMVTGEIKGASLVGHFAEHVINFFTLAIVKKMTVWEIETFIVPYPTYFSGIDDLYDQFLVEWKENKSYYQVLWIKDFLWTILPFVSLIGISVTLLLTVVL